MWMLYTIDSRQNACPSWKNVTLALHKPCVLSAYWGILQSSDKVSSFNLPPEITIEVTYEESAAIKALHPVENLMSRQMFCCFKGYHQHLRFHIIFSLNHILLLFLVLQDWETFLENLYKVLEHKAWDSWRIKEFCSPSPSHGVCLFNIGFTSVINQRSIKLNTCKWVLAYHFLKNVWDFWLTPYYK